MASTQELWQSARREAEAIVGADPVLAASLGRTVFDHPGLGSAPAILIRQQLGATVHDRVRFARARPLQPRPTSQRLQASP